MAIITQDEDKPRNVIKAFFDLDKENWTKAIEEENGVYEIKSSLGTC